MKLRPHIALSGRTQWTIWNANFEHPEKDEVVEIVVSLLGTYRERYVMGELEKLLNRADIEWIYVYQGKVRINADADQASHVLNRQHVPWFKGLLEIEPIVDAEDESTVVRLVINRSQIKLATISGGDFSLGLQLKNFRRLVTWIPLLIAFCFSAFSLVADLDVKFEFKLFSRSGAVLAVSAGWLELWLWLWQRSPNKQPIQPTELTVSMVVGYCVLALGTFFWSFGDLLVELFGTCS